MYPGQVRAVFGSVGDRFIPPKIPKIPGPGAYELDHPVNPKTSNPDYAAKTVYFGAEASKTAPFYAGAGGESGVVHAPVFGSQTSRFQDKVEGISLFCLYALFTRLHAPHLLRYPTSWRLQCF